MVLILVVVDDGLVLHKSNTARHQVERVLILIVVDDGLVLDYAKGAHRVMRVKS